MDLETDTVLRMADDKPKIAWLSGLVHVCAIVNHQRERNPHHGITFDDVYDGIENGTLWREIEIKIPGFDRFGILNGDGPQGSAILQTLKYIAEYFAGDESRKCGVEFDGLALLTALCLEAIAGDMWTRPEPGRVQTPEATSWN